MSGVMEFLGDGIGLKIFPVLKFSFFRVLCLLIS